MITVPMLLDILWHIHDKTEYALSCVTKINLTLSIEIIQFHFDN